MKTRQKWAVIATICFAAGFPVAVPYFIMTSKVSAENMDFAFDIAESLAISLTTPIDDSSNSGLIGNVIKILMTRKRQELKNVPVFFFCNNL